MLHQARRDGRIDVAQACLLAFMGRPHPTPEEEAGAGLLAWGLSDLHAAAVLLGMKE